MTTKIVQQKTQPAVVMDKLHVDSFTFKQTRTTTTKRQIGIAGCLFGDDENGESVFDVETFGVSDQDIDTTIVQAAMAGGQTPSAFQADYVAAKAVIDAGIQGGTISDATLMAYFEAVLGRILEIHGKITISGVE